MQPEGGHPAPTPAPAPTPPSSAAPAPAPSPTSARAAKDEDDDEIAGPLTDPLVPIRLDLVVDGKHTTEAFTWNALEAGITPRQFAQVLVHDLALGDGAVDELAASIQEQLDAFVPARRRRVGAGESRQVVRLNLRMGRVVLRDQFEWDLNAPDNDPESFATQLCIEMGLGAAYAPAVASAVREQLNELAEFEDKRMARTALSPATALRPPADAQLWEPRVECLSIDEQVRLERKEKRDARLQRRNRGKDYAKPRASNEDAAAPRNARRRR